jgi:hypothetical protein
MMHWAITLTSAMAILTTTIQISTKLVLNWCLEYALHNALLQQSSKLEYVATAFIILVATSEIIHIKPKSNWSIGASCVFAVVWLLWRHNTFVNIVWSLAYTYLTWMRIEHDDSTHILNYVFATFLTFISVSSVELWQTHIIGAICRTVAVYILVNA